LLTQWDEVSLWQQRLVCECGGSMRLELDGWLHPYSGSAGMWMRRFSAGVRCASALVPTGAYRLDRQGRRLSVKRRIKRPIFIALGMWPEQAHAEVLAWRLAAKEDEADWLAVFSELEALGVRAENGL
jgi:hypothetical protein